MKYDWLDEYLLSLPGAEKDYKPEWAWFRYRLRGKLFAAVCSPQGMKDEAYNGHDLAKFSRRPTRKSCRASTATSGTGSPAFWTGNCRMKPSGSSAPSPTGWF